MRKIILFLLLLGFQQAVFCQNQVMDPLKAKLKYAKEDTAKLSIYLSLGTSPDGKENLLYVDSAWKLLDKLFLKENKSSVQKDLIEVENGLPALVIDNNSTKDTTDWNKALPYLKDKLNGIEKTGNKLRSAHFLYTMARIYLDGKRDSASFRYYITKSIAAATEGKDTALIVSGYQFMCSFYKSAGNFSEALAAIQSATEISRKFNYKKGLASSLTLLAEMYAEFGEEATAVENFKKALDISHAINDTNEISNTLVSQAGFYTMKKNYQKALEYLNDALVLNKGNATNKYTEGTIYRIMGEVYTESTDYKNALLNFEKSLDKAASENDIVTKAWTLHDIGVLYNRQGNFEKAVEYHTRSLGILDSTADRGQYKPYLLYYLAKDKYGLKKYAEAKALNDQALVDFKKRWFDIRTPSEMELLASQIDSARGDGLGALAHYKQYTLLADRIKGEEIGKAALKDNFRAELEKQQSEQEKKDAIAQRTRNLQYVAIGAFLLMGIFLLYGYVQKNKDKKKIEKAYGELKSTQAQLIQSEKMASLGELTAGIAHEIQNPLNFINNFSEVNKEMVDEVNEELSNGNIEEAKVILKDIKDNSEKINHHGKRADAIVKGMLQHSNSKGGQRELTDINKLADEYLRLAYHGIRAKDNSFNATLKTEYDETIGNINIIPQDIGRVVLNLITNAFYTVDEKRKTLPAASAPAAVGIPYEPTIIVKTSHTPPLPNSSGHVGGGVAGSVLITVSDNGNGIPQNILDKIFQPFFTTKPTGQGTGLGLSLAYDIVKAHGGELKVETKEGTGTTFIISLPAV